MTKGSIRLRYAIAATCILLAEVLIALYVRDGFVRPYLGDVLAVVLLFCLLRIFFPTGMRWLAVFVFFFAVALEILQGLDFVSRLGLMEHRWLSLLLGTTFSVGDLFCYFAGAAICQIGEGVWLRTRQGQPPQDRA